MIEKLTELRGVFIENVLRLNQNFLQQFVEDGSLSEEQLRLLLWQQHREWQRVGRGEEARERHTTFMDTENVSKVVRGVYLEQWHQLMDNALEWKQRQITKALELEQAMDNMPHAYEVCEPLMPAAMGVAVHFALFHGLPFNDEHFLSWLDAVTAGHGLDNAKEWVKNLSSSLFNEMWRVSSVKGCITYGGARYKSWQSTMNFAFATDVMLNARGSMATSSALCGPRTAFRRCCRFWRTQRSGGSP